MKVTASDRDVLRLLAGQLAEAAADPVNRQRAADWQSMNDLKPVRPMVWINELPWEEMNTGDELTLRCTDGFLRGLETHMRRQLYQWRHLQADMIIDPWFPLAPVISDSGYGISIMEETRAHRADGSVVSHHYENQFKTLRDVERIRMPELRLDEEASAAQLSLVTGIFGDILPVRRAGIGGQWFAPWDRLVMWYNPQEALLDMMDKPELIHALMDRLVTAMLSRLDQQIRLNVLALNNGACRIGSGGYGHTSELPGPGFDPACVRTADQWGCATAQIFSEVSPAMHEEFALQYERRWLQRFGLTYYGCCEPLHNKLDILKSVPNLRKISVSPWANVDTVVSAAGSRYVLSLKPSPAVLAEDRWNPERVRKDLRRLLDATQGCAVELILKDISTVRNEPARLREWAGIAMQEAGSR